MTKQVASYPKNYEQLRHTVRNFKELTALLFSKEAILTTRLTELLDHVIVLERKYRQCFHDQSFFGASFVDKIHNRVQMYLQSCAHDDPQALDLTALDWTDWLNKIALNEFLAFPPYWLDTIDENDNNKRHETSGGTTGPNKKGCTESYQKVFHVRNKLGISPPPPFANNGTRVSHKFYATGHCKHSYRRSHTPLDEDERRTWRAFINHCRDRYHSFINNMERFNRTPTIQTQHTQQQTTLLGSKHQPDTHLVQYPNLCSG